MGGVPHETLVSPSGIPGSHTVAQARKGQPCSQRPVLPSVFSSVRVPPVPLPHGAALGSRRVWEGLGGSGGVLMGLGGPGRVLESLGGSGGSLGGLGGSRSASEGLRGPGKVAEGLGGSQRVWEGLGVSEGPWRVWEGLGGPAPKEDGGGCLQSVSTRVGELKHTRVCLSRGFLIYFLQIAKRIG